MCLNTVFKLDLLHITEEKDKKNFFVFLAWAKQRASHNYIR